MIKQEEEEIEVDFRLKIDSALDAIKEKLTNQVARQREGLITVEECRKAMSASTWEMLVRIMPKHPEFRFFASRPHLEIEAYSNGGEEFRVRVFDTSDNPGYRDGKNVDFSASFSLPRNELEVLMYATMFQDNEGPFYLAARAIIEKIDELKDKPHLHPVA